MRQFLIFICFCFTGWGAFAQHPVKPHVVVTFSILEDWVKNIAGDKVDISTLVPRLNDPHLYQLKPMDMITIKQANLIIAHGLGFEGWLKRVLEETYIKDKYVEVAGKIDARMLPDGTQDPHVWHDLKLVTQIIPEIVKVLTRLCPSHEKVFAKNGENYIRKLRALDGEIKAQFETIAPSKRFVLTTHDAFWYFGRAYGVIFLAPVGITTEQEPSAIAIAHLIDKIRAHSIRAIFIESLSNSRVVEQIAKETGRRPGGVLYADSLSEAGGKASTYIDMVRYNAEKILLSF